MGKTREIKNFLLPPRDLGEVI